MLRIIIPGDEQFDEANDKFLIVGTVAVDFEHSLVSLSKWESKIQKPFLGPDKKTSEDVFEYIKCMVLNKDFDYKKLDKLTNENLSQINSYIDSKETATTFSDIHERKGRTEVVTSELIYFWMISFNIPFSCETWHLNRLLTLIRICNIKKSKPKIISKAEIARRNRDLNAERRARLNSSG